MFVTDKQKNANVPVVPDFRIRHFFFSGFVIPTQYNPDFVIPLCAFSLRLIANIFVYLHLAFYK